jgi:hypothetical protein
MVTNSFGNRNFMQPMGRPSMHSKCLDFFPFKFWVVGRGGGGGGRIFCFPLFPTCFLQVPNGFSICSLCVSPRLFPIAPCFNPICFAQSPPLLTYIGGPKGEALHLSIESSIMGSLHSSISYLPWANQIGSLPHKKKLDLWGNPN